MDVAHIAPRLMVEGMAAAEVTMTAKRIESGLEAAERA
jgi:hypothetical protein